MLPDVAGNTASVGGVVAGAEAPAADDVADTRHLMVDIETLGSRPSAIIASIGAVIFSPERVLNEIEIIVDTRSCQDAGLTFDAETVEWWMRQSKAAREATFGIKGTPIKTALAELAAFSEHYGVADYWSHGATFDLVLLKEASVITGAPPLVKDFRRARDTRTLYEITGVNPKTFMGTGTAHNAVDDARAQALAVIESWRILRRWKNAANDAQRVASAVQFTPWGPASVH